MIHRPPVLPVIIQLFLDPLHNDSHDEVEHIVENSGCDKRDHICLGCCQGFRDREHLSDTQGERQGRILYKCDHLVCDRRQNSLDDLRQNDLEKGLSFRVAKDLCRLILTDRHRLNAAAVDLCKICRVVDHKADKGRCQAVTAADFNMKQIVWSEINDHQLQH